MHTDFVLDALEQARYARQSATATITHWPRQINGLYKAKIIHRRVPWRILETVELATLERVAWFNHRRLLEPISYIPPAEAEANYYLQLSD
jgi:transposase InsO family protein